MKHRIRHRGRRGETLRIGDITIQIQGTGPHGVSLVIHKESTTPIELLSPSDAENPFGVTRPLTPHERELEADAVRMATRTRRAS